MASIERVEDVLPTRELLEAASALVEYYERIHGFTAGSVARASRVLRSAREKCDLRVLSFTGNIVASGLRGLLAWLLEEEHFNLVVTTCGAIDHDIAKSEGGVYIKGHFFADDYELEKLGIHRLGNIFIPRDSYGPLVERFVKRLMNDVAERARKISGHELLWEAGSRINDKASILRAARSRKIPIVVPGFYDGSFGTNVYIYSKALGVDVDLRADQEMLSERFFGVKECVAALVVGGGISKHHVLWWSQFSGGLDYAVYVTTAVEYDGSLSGALPREAVTWSKIKSTAEYAVVHGDATVILPMLASTFLRP